MTENERSPQQLHKSIYVDVDSLSALEYLQNLPRKPGIRFSRVLLFREFIQHMRNNPSAMLNFSGWEKRRKSAGKNVIFTLPSGLKEEISWLESFYAQHAPPSPRIRDGAPKTKRLPISQLFCAYLQEIAAAQGWKPD